MNDENSLTYVRDYSDLLRELPWGVEGTNVDGSYTFKTASPATQVDVYSIAEELSAAKPVAYVEVNAEEWFGYFLVHRTLAAKDYEIFESNYRHGEYLHDGTLIIRVKAKHTLKQFLSHFKKVKKHSWPVCSRKAVEVKVSFPEL